MTVKPLFFMLCILFCGCNDESKKLSINEAPCLRGGTPFDPIIFEQPGFHLYVIGDTGTGNENQLTSARVLESYHLQYNLDGIIHTGDIFYPKGLSSADDEAGYDKFNAIYQSLALTAIPWFLSAGNHEHDGSINALIEFSQLNEGIYYPDNYYLKTLVKTDLSWQVNLMVTDTTPFTHGLIQAEQLSWLQNQLASQSTEMNLVIGHHPIFSNGAHGGTKELQGSFYQALVRYAVPLYLSGHEHSLQLLSAKNNSHFLISGAGGAALTNISCSENNLYGNKIYGGFALFITKDVIWVIPVTTDGSEVMFAISLAK